MTKIELEIMRRKLDAEMAATAVVVQLGLSSGEYTYSRAIEVYGAWFKEAVREGKIRPSRYGSNGRVKYFSVSDILATRATEFEMMEL